MMKYNQVLEMFESKYLMGVLYEYQGYTIGIMGSDFMLEMGLVIGSIIIYICGNMTKELYVEKVLNVLYNMIKDLINNLCVQQINTANTVISIFIINIFTLLLFFNIYGLLPLSYSVTSQLSITVYLSFSVCLGVTIIGFLNMSYNYLYLFITNEGEMPTAIVPFLIVIEFLSYSARYFSLGLRLFANMMAGHSLMVILSKFFLGFFDKFVNIFDLVLIVLLLLMLAIVLLEVGVSFLQAYVFVLLISIYLSESTNYHNNVGG